MRVGLRAIWAMATLGVTVAALGGSVAVASGARSGESSADVRLTIVTRIGTPGSTTDVRLELPLGGRLELAVRKLRSTPVDYSQSYREALEQAFRAGGLLDANQASLLVGAGSALPQLKIADRTATLTVQVPGTPIWNETHNGERLALPEIVVPENGHLSVHLDVVGVEAVAARPLPNVDNGNGKLRWEFPGGSSSDIAVLLSEPLPLYSEYSANAPIAYYLVSGLPFVLLLLLFRRRRELFAPPPPLALLALAGVALCVSCAAFFAYAEWGPTSSGEFRRFADAMLPAFGIIALVAVPQFARWLRTGVAALLSIGFALAVATHSHAQMIGFVADLGLPDTQIVLALLFAAALLALILGAVIRWSWEILPHPAREKLAAKLPRAGIAVAIGLIVAALTAQVLLATSDQEGSAGFIGGKPDWSIALETFLDTFSLQLAVLGRNMASTAMGIGISIWLWRQAGDGEIPFENWRECAALALLFATTTIGVSGEIDGYAAPLAFLFAVAGGGLAIRLLARAPRARLAGSASIREQSRNLLGRAVRLTAMKRSRHALADRMIAGNIGEGEHDAQLQELDRRRAALFDVEVLASVEPEDRPREALTLGLTGEGGARNRLSTLFHRGWWIFAAPIAYSIYSVLHLSIGSSLQAAFGPPFVIVGLVDQVLMWPIAAWLFLLLMPILPGRIGPLKGLAAGAFCVLPQLLARPLVEDPPGSDQWLFISAELTLVFVAVGFVLDFRSVRRIGGDLRQLGELYSITSVRAGLAYLAPLALLLFSVLHGLANGSGSEALEELASSAGALLPSGR